MDSNFQTNTHISSISPRTRIWPGISYFTHIRMPSTCCCDAAV